jgi:hypothetical protein
MGTKGQLEGSAVTGRTGKPGVAKTDRKTCNAAGQNNSNPTPYVASAFLSSKSSDLSESSIQIARNLNLDAD